MNGILEIVTLATDAIELSLLCNGKETQLVHVTVWAKHPLLLAAAEEDPSSALGGASEQECCLNGFEAVERSAGRPSELCLVRSDASDAEFQDVLGREIQRIQHAHQTS